MSILKKVCAVTVLAIAAAGIIFCTGKDYLDGVDEMVVEELDRYGVEAVDYAEVSKMRIPRTLTGAGWDLVGISCTQGGYDLGSYTGQTLNYTIVDIKGTCGAEPVMIRVFSTEDKIVCTYLSIRENSSAAPGVWPINEEYCDIDSSSSTTPCN